MNKKFEEDDDQNFIQKDDVKAADKLDEEKNTEPKKLKSAVFPKVNQQRNLSRETGGLEEKKDDAISEDDVWDERSEEVLKTGKDVFNSSGVRSIIWKNKKKRIEDAQLALELAALTKTLKGQNVTTKQEGYVSRLKNLKQDRSTIGNISR